jgi:hypothetical protein
VALWDCRWAYDPDRPSRVAGARKSELGLN